MKGDNTMSNRVFTFEEMENIFEIGRHMQYMMSNEEIEIEDSTNAFLFAMQLAIEFEEQHPETEEYYSDLIEFVEGRILDEFGVED